MVDLDFIETVLKNNPNSIVVVDEAYIDFGGTSCVPVSYTHLDVYKRQTQEHIGLLEQSYKY